MQIIPEHIQHNNERVTKITSRLISLSYNWNTILA